MAQALVYGWYGRNNVGDELMRSALEDMFEPNGLSLRFVDRLVGTEVEATDAVIFGGGSILYDAPDCDQRAWELMSRNERPVFYLGVGMETNIHAMHLQFMAVARSLITRSETWPKHLNNVYAIPDLVYALSGSTPEITGSNVLVIPNVEVLPTWSDPHWMHVGWERFKDEMAQALDVICTDRGAPPTFLLMCKNPTQDDRWVAHEIISRMRSRSTLFNVLQAQPTAPGLTALISEFKVVITQRYHGIVLAQMSGVPHISIDHHDKLKKAWPRKGISLPYHGFTKDALLQAYDLAAATPREQIRVSREMYDRLASVIVGIIEQERKTRGEQVRGSP